MVRKCPYCLVEQPEKPEENSVEHLDLDINDLCIDCGREIGNTAIETTAVNDEDDDFDDFDDWDDYEDEIYDEYEEDYDCDE